MKFDTSALAPVCDAIAILIPGQVEVVLHDLTTGRIAHMSGTFSNRSVGDESLLDMEETRHTSPKPGVIGPYAKRNWDGGRIRAVSAVIPGDKGTAAAMICINMLTGDLEAAAEMLSALTAIPSDPRSRPLVDGDWRESANKIIARVLEERHIALAAARREDRIAILSAIDTAGILQIRGAADYLATALGISRASLYATLKHVRDAQETS